MKFKYKSIFWGLLIILIAVALVLNGLGMITTSFSTIVCTVIMLGILINGVIDLSFMAILFAVAHLLIFFRESIPLPEDLKSWVVIIAGTMLGLGLDIIFKAPVKMLKSKFSGKHVYSSATGDDIVSDCNSTFADATIKISNTFGEQTEYVNSNNLQSGKIENSFGNLTVYLDQVTLQNDAAWLVVKNGFGKTTLNIPSSFRLELTKSNGFGNIHMMGQPSTDPSAPIIHIKAENGFGDLLIRCN